MHFDGSGNYVSIASASLCELPFVCGRMGRFRSFSLIMGVIINEATHM